MRNLQQKHYKLHLMFNKNFIFAKVAFTYHKVQFA